MKNAVIAEQLLTVRDYLRYGVSLLGEHPVYFGHGTDNAWDEALSLVLCTLKLPLNTSEHVLDARLLTGEREKLIENLHRRVFDRVPVPYITHQSWFCGLEFYIDERALIPRSPIAEVIQAYFKPWYQGEYPSKILDLCAGSGCIGIACAYAFEDAEVTVSDISQDALDVAAINVEKHQLQEQVSLVQSDLFEQVVGEFDIIVSNPPYVDSGDYSSMPEEFVHEPGMALTSGEFGMDHPIAILQAAQKHLTEDGVLVLEVGNSGEHLEMLLPNVDFNWVEFENGGHGVLVISRAELEYHTDDINELALGFCG
ncbi:50S ribosomal protein L3 glutamine methyltransferase [BD1-7 clade bacterium]|uniref:50S ribosomal protein L3 glutamine methyltransferase n=1 Tax=BD1-7 clade bacterium TaxID=2029982 RepID=A0A5S9QKK5_9GAMM|nr:50S ribosomal protein L3 glutamine methyltransferase [BD1-7 clade bacterium]